MQLHALRIHARQEELSRGHNRGGGCPAASLSRGKRCRSAWPPAARACIIVTSPRTQAGMLDRLTRSRVLRLSRLEQVKDVLRARGSPKSEETVIRIGESPTTADRHEARVPDLREDHGWQSFCIHPPTTHGAQARPREQACKSGGRIRKCVCDRRTAESGELGRPPSGMSGCMPWGLLSQAVGDALDLVAWNRGSKGSRWLRLRCPRQ